MIIERTKFEMWTIDRSPMEKEQRERKKERERERENERERNS